MATTYAPAIRSEIYGDPSTMLSRAARAPVVRCSSLAARSRCCSNAALQHAALREELEGVQQRMRALEGAHPELRSSHNAKDAFSPPKLHHINIVSRAVPGLLHFYRDVMRMGEMPVDMARAANRTRPSP